MQDVREDETVSLSMPPEVALWMSVHENCRMRAEFELGDCDAPNVHFIMGSDSDDKHLKFERVALERFTELAQRILAIPFEEYPQSPPDVVLESSYGYGIRALNRR